MAKKTNEDLFGEGKTMTFGEHLEELRVCLFRSVMGICVGCIVGFFIANGVVRFFQGPLERAMERYYLSKAISDNRDLSVEDKRLILDEGLIREPMQVETAEIAQSLRLTYPEQFGDLVLSPYWFSAGDLVSPPAAHEIAGRLAAAGKGDGDPQAQAIWEVLSAEQRKSIEALAKAEVDFTPEQNSQLLAVLNAAAGQPALHDVKALANLTGPDNDPSAAAQSSINFVTSWFTRLLGIGAPLGTDTIVDLRAELAKAPNAETSRRLNKLLIARVFPNELRKARVNLLTIYSWKPVKVRFQVLNAQEAFMIWLKAALTTGLVFASPYIFYQIWIFVAAGLYPHEKNYVYLYLPVSIGLFLGGASLAFVFVFDPVLDFLFTFNKGMNADFDPRIGEWLGFVLILPLGFGISFQLPLVMLFLNRIGVVSIEVYINQWRIAILTIFVIAMILTPADPISMLLMAGPLCALYVLGILMCKYMPKGRNPFAEAYEP
ncbi:MAG: twin-arginine translocase subunit TatC [Pirellulaceae bacterium]|nr:twin-arginine translocase subunit TatC [Pirellulaceae bacterium]